MADIEVFEVSLHSDNMWLTNCLKFFQKRIKLTKGVCRGLWCYTASPEELLIFFKRQPWVSLADVISSRISCGWHEVFEVHLYSDMYPTCNCATRTQWLVISLLWIVCHIPKMWVYVTTNTLEARHGSIKINTGTLESGHGNIRVAVK